MRKLLRWILWLVALSGLAYLVAALPVGGRTLLERLLGHSNRSREEASQRGEPGAAQTDRQSKTKDTDRLTEDDRQALDNLIRSKLKEEGGGSPSAKP